jgi:bifunctional ADP-heptose synthase (sugar kinase/adenylyltransferase)
MKVLFAARKRATPKGTVVCALDSDKKIAASKGKGRPILSWIERATALSYMPIDTIVEIEGPEDMATLIANLQPDERVQGSDYASHTSSYPIPKLFVRDAGMHTSTIIDRIQALPNPTTNDQDSDPFA